MKMQRTRVSKILLSLMVLMLFMVIPAFRVQAAETGSITRKCKAPVADVEYKIYKVGVMDGHDGYELIDEFAAYSVNLFEQTAASTLEGYVQRDDITPLDVKFSDANGTVTFDNLPIGAYLVLGDSYVVEEGTKKTTYTPNPVVVSIPSADEEDEDARIYDVVIDGKDGEVSVDKAKLIVKKVWKNDTASKRPKSIKVQILKDKKVYKEIELNAENNWTYEWAITEEEKTAEWTAVEKTTPNGYTVSLEKNNGVFVLTNKGTTPPPPPPHIPQTGQEWWPILMMIAGGLFLILIGLLLVKRQDNLK